ncbi:MAG TPA: ABC transporter substrate-binding protein, partial [Burkholderiaceae bacterium]|nr:ABC transporter substrate-binding protein [Burkholderiaceae bacterium]
MPSFAPRHTVRALATACLGTTLLLGASQAAAQGTVNALCSTDAGWCEAAATAFTRETGIKVQQAHKGTGEIGAQLRAEAANPKTDLWWGGTGDPFLQAAEQGLLEPYRPAYINDLHDWSVRQYAMSGNRVGGFYTSAMGFGFNTEVLKKKKLSEPRCWADLVKPVYRGEIEMSHPATSGTGYTIIAGLVQLMGEDAAFDYLKKLHRNTTTYTRSGQAQAPNVAKGEVAVGISFIFGFDKWRHDKYPVKAVAPCEGTGYEIGGIALVKGARNRANAQRYYD